MNMKFKMIGERVTIMFQRLWNPNLKEMCPYWGYQFCPCMFFYYEMYVKPWTIFAKHNQIVVKLRLSESKTRSTTTVDPQHFKVKE